MSYVFVSKFIYPIFGKHINNIELELIALFSLVRFVLRRKIKIRFLITTTLEYTHDLNVTFLQDTSL